MHRAGVNVGCALALMILAASPLAGQEELRWEDLEEAEFEADLGQWPLEVDTEPRRWTPGLTFTTGLGYRDNVAFSATDAAPSSFWLAGGEFFLMRLPDHGPEFFLLLSAENYHFLENDFRDERLVTALARATFKIAPRWSAGTDLFAYYSDQIMDLSAEHVDVAPLPLRGTVVGVTPFLRRQFEVAAYVKAAVSASRHIFEAPLDDYLEAGPKLTLGIGGKPREFTLNYQWLRREYDERVARDSSGEPLAGRETTFVINRVEGEWRQAWGRSDRLGTSTRAGVEWNRDRGSGFYDYRRYRLGQRVEYQLGAWLGRAGLQFSRYEYDTQTASPESNHGRRRNQTSLEVGATRQLSEALTVTVDYEREQVRGDRTLGDYTVNTIWSGIRWEF